MQGMRHMREIRVLRIAVGISFMRRMYSRTTQETSEVSTVVRLSTSRFHAH